MTIKPFMTQINEISDLNKAIGLLPHEYYEDFHLYKTDVSLQEAECYVGAYQARQWYAFHTPASFKIFEDRLLTYYWLDEQQLPQPPLYFAMKHIQYLQTVILKPRLVKSQENIKRISYWDVKNLIPNVFVDSAAYIIQDYLHPHYGLQPYLDAAASSALPTLRFTLMNNAIVHVMLRLSLTNFSLADTGDHVCVATVNRDRQVERFYSPSNVELPPALMQPLGVPLPYASELVPLLDKIIMSLSTLAQDSYLVSVDVALTDEGPMIMDINTCPDLRLLQISQQKGFKYNVADTHVIQSSFLKKLGVVMCGDDSNYAAA